MTFPVLRVLIIISVNNRYLEGRPRIFKYERHENVCLDKNFSG